MAIAEKPSDEAIKEEAKKIRAPIRFGILFDRIQDCKSNAYAKY